jgi:hypothetical protein
MLPVTLFYFGFLTTVFGLFFKFFTELTFLPRNFLLWFSVSDLGFLLWFYTSVTWTKVLTLVSWICFVTLVFRLGFLPSVLDLGFIFWFFTILLRFFTFVPSNLFSTLFSFNSVFWPRIYGFDFSFWVFERSIWRWFHDLGFENSVFSAFRPFLLIL